MFARRPTRRSFRPTLDALQERIAPVSLMYVPPITADVSFLSTSPVMTTTTTSGGSDLLATSPVCTSG
jgi:hypothetical protein